MHGGYSRLRRVQRALHRALPMPGAAGAPRRIASACGAARVPSSRHAGRCGA
ncbi:hypothetical protein BURMUCF1_0815 [Burkholderia multivorans ATCC BAA-247]|nr:hypothetical protein BURMUCF1_0815 [Burkholderia multivorans ATCC BAA-247]